MEPISLLMVAFLVVGGIVALVAYTAGLRQAQENQVKRIVERERAARGWENPSVWSTGVSERERLEAESELGVLDLERGQRLAYLRWHERAWERLTADEREHVRQLESHWPSTAEELRRREEAIFALLRRAGGDPPQPLRHGSR